MEKRLIKEVVIKYYETKQEDDKRVIRKETKESVWFNDGEARHNPTMSSKTEIF